MTKEEKETSGGKFPGTNNGMFIEFFEFSPERNLKSDELLEVLRTVVGLGNEADLLATLRALKIRMNRDAFDNLSENAKKHFKVHNRYGAEESYAAIKRRNNKNMAK